MRSSGSRFEQNRRGGRRIMTPHIATVSAAAVALAAVVAPARAGQDALPIDTAITEPVLKFDWPAVEVGTATYETGPTGRHGDPLSAAGGRRDRCARRLARHLRQRWAAARLSTQTDRCGRLCRRIDPWVPRHWSATGKLYLQVRIAKLLGASNIAPQSNELGDKNG